MKRHLTFLCAVSLLASMTGCVPSADESKKEIASVSTSVNESETKVVEEQEETAEANALPEIGEQVLWESDGVKVTALGIEEDTFWGAAVKVLIENSSDKDVRLGLDALIVNDFMISDLTSFEVTAGNKSNESIILLSSELEAAGIENIGKIEMYMHTYDPETYDTLNESGCIEITTSDAENADTEASIEGVTLYDQNGIKIVGQYVDENSFWGASALLYVENNTDKNFILHGDDVAINGFMITSSCYQPVYAGKKSVTNVTFFDSDLEANGITSIDEIEMSFRMTDDNYTEIANSGKVKFSAK